MSLLFTSPDFIHRQPIPSKFTCDGENINPAFNISSVPVKAQSLALIVDDPDAPGKAWVHWVISDIPSGTAEIAENSVPAGAVLGKNDFGKLDWGGPCPPSGTHRYFFKLYALDTELDLPEGASKANVEAAMKDHILEQTELVGTYQRQ